jgi:hypothetical protein
MRHLSPPGEAIQNCLFDAQTLDDCGWWATDLDDSARRHLQDNWQGVMRRSLLALMPAQQLGSHFSEHFGRPTKELYSMAALIFILEFKDWTIDQAAEAYTFDTSLHFALNLSNRRNYLCPRSVDSYRRLMREDRLAASVFAQVTDTLVKELDIRISRQRLDSTHVLSDMASFGRTRLLGITVKRFLTSLKRHTPKQHSDLPVELIERYSPSIGALFGLAVKQAEARSAIRQQTAEDMHLLIERFADEESIAKRSSYMAMVRLFGEHCQIQEKRIIVRAKARDEQGGSASTLQNPSDLEAGYGHKGPGYQVQLAESSHEDNDVQLVLVCLPQSAAESDANAAVDVITELTTRGHKPDEVASDTAYGSDENYLHAQAHGIDWISPTPGAQPKQGHQGAMTREIAEPGAGEPRGAGRPQTQQQKARRQKARRSARRREGEQSEEWQAKYRRRAGIEGLHRGIDRRTGFKQLRVRGLKAVTHSTYGKVMGWNILQAARATAKKRVQAAKAAKKPRQIIWAAVKRLWPSWKEAVLSISSAMDGVLKPHWAGPCLRPRYG